MSFDVVTAFTSAAVPFNGTITLGYPTGRSSGHYSAVGHVARASGLMNDLALNTGFTLTFNDVVASGVTFTYKGSTTIPAGTKVTVQLNLRGTDGAVPDSGLPAIPRAQMGTLQRINFGTPIAAVANNIATSQSIGAAGSAVLALTTLDVPRNVVAAWTTNSNVTVTGTDEYGATLTESVTGVAVLTGKKAFKTITSITSSAAITLFTAGVGDVLGLPIYVEGSGAILAESLDGAAATAGVLVGGVSTAASGTTGDVRGTYDPNAACDAARDFGLIVNVDDYSFKGVAQA